MDSKAGIFTVGVIGLTTLYYGKKYFAGGVCKITKDLSGQVIVITGSNAGIGKETARTLGRMGATIILACRSEEKTLAVVEELKEETHNNNIVFLKLDLADLSSIKSFATEFKKRYQRLDILINNAGLADAHRSLTKDGFESTLGTNHLGPFYLTSLLLDVIKKTAPSRIINVASIGHLGAKINWDDIMSEKSYDVTSSYIQSKLANVMFTRELQKRVANDNVKVVCLHPGLVVTDIYNNIKKSIMIKLAMTVAMNPIANYFWKTPAQGAQTTLYCALEDYEKLKQGAYYSDCKVKRESKLARNDDDCKRLWELSKKLLAEKINE